MSHICFCLWEWEAETDSTEGLLTFLFIMHYYVKGYLI